MTRSDLRASEGDNFPNGGNGDVASIDIGVDVAAVAGKRREATGNEVKPVRGGECAELHDGPEQHAPRPSSLQLGEPMHPKAC